MDRVNHLPQIIQLDEELQQEVWVPKSHPTTLCNILLFDDMNGGCPGHTYVTPM